MNGTGTFDSIERLAWRAVRYLDESYETEWEGFVQLPGLQIV